MTAVLDRLDLPGLQERLDAEGVATTPPLLTAAQCADVVAMFDEDERFRSTVVNVSDTGTDHRALNIALREPGIN